MIKDVQDPHCVGIGFAAIGRGGIYAEGRMGFLLTGFGAGGNRPGRRRRELSEEISFRSEPLLDRHALRDEWQAIESRARPSFFTSWHWIGTLLAAVGDGWQPRVLRGHQHGETVALALLGSSTKRRRSGLIRVRGLHLNETGDPRFDCLMAEHNGPIAVAGCEAAALDGLIAWFAAEDARSDELYLPGLAERPPTGGAERHGLLGQELAYPSFAVELSRLTATGGTLAPLLSANARQQLRRALRHFERFGELRLERAKTLAEALDFFDELKRLHCASWERRGKAHSFTRPFFEPFHRLLIERCFKAGAVELLRASAGSRVLGYLYNFRGGDRVYAYQSGFADEDRAERPGVVTHALAIEASFRAGAQVYDFMAGRNQLKESFATARTEMVWQTVQQPRLAFRAEHWARRLRDAWRAAYAAKNLLPATESARYGKAPQ
jgi:CelD/BcsL family acetyltransferase involved in cellulose biosynthesis